MKIKLDNFEKRINIYFKDKELLNKALTHKSTDQKYNNEKLEFLGDRVLGLVLAKKLYDLYPDESEGVLDKRFAKLVNKKTCSEIALSLGIQNYIKIGDNHKKITSKDEKILSDSCEALIGAIYNDKGFSIASDFVLKSWRNKIRDSHVTVLDSKTELQEYSLKKYKKLPTYSFVSSRGPRHNPIFKISVSITGSKIFTGSGKSKQEAEQNGAKNLLKSINVK